ncbi:hypothetical protein FZC76_12800 [Sutcliffiella horikoshii]|uniref:Uncharacterized protein n=1 Tax=Sutcliffiella horikoshii TaxID=79883 RepID=A0A5D4SZ12_9BACI|nr:hypothetical protein [Sutcliffiella horikoshii]TYS67462.1 hypothetical protein FZC76_12800 [Sutcliffiella horikoshii]
MNYKNSISDTKLKMVQLEREFKRLENLKQEQDVTTLHDRLIRINKDIDALILEANKRTGRVNEGMLI